MPKTPEEIRQLIEDYKSNPVSQPFKDDLTKEELLAAEKDVKTACQAILQIIASGKEQSNQETK